MQKKAPEDLVEKHTDDSKSSKVRWKVRNNLSESLINESTNDFLRCIENQGLDFAVHIIKEYNKWLSSEIADLLLWVSSCDMLADLVSKMKYNMTYGSDIDLEKEKKKNKRLIKKYQETGDNELLDELIHEMNLDQKDQIEKEKTIVFLLNPQKVDKYILAVAENIDLFTKISGEWLKVLIDAWYNNEVYEYLKKHKNYTKKS